MPFVYWLLLIGALLIWVSLSKASLTRLLLSTSMLYLAVGYGLGPAGWAILSPDPLVYTVTLERVAEVAVLISLFSIGLKLSIPLKDKRWRLPICLALVSMTITVLLTAAIGIAVLGLSLGAAVLLGAILAPTDPVLASRVQVQGTDDRDRLRFSLTGEGGLNDGAAFPFAMLGLGLLGLHDLGIFGWRWLVVDVLWALIGGLVIGAITGTAIGRLVTFLRHRYRAEVGLDEFLALGLIALAYGFAVLSHTNGFLSVFAAALALQRMERRDAGVTPPPDGQAGFTTGLSTERTTELTTEHPAGLTAALAADLAAGPSHRWVHEGSGAGFIEQMERIAEMVVVLLVGAMLWYSHLHAKAIWLVLLLLLVARPLSVWFGILGARVSNDQRLLISWFGIRGIGSIYYLMYAINQGVPDSMAEELISLTLTVVTVSIVVHGISVTPLMKLYARRKARQHGF
ncbi:cation:proton antiporter [Halomonas korlensis]|uniref:Sodium/proton antiporter, CPA1 family n=1 Tax=Halomonas korlensis TaxID=463301 RepID=A0A1I7INL5_9GAMM|nr:cation:proton antiporter [Halomonas korlensis]SFU74543.1 sodium/proton antiporter, CPA1 family [Halomonas korlensis]